MNGIGVAISEACVGLTYPLHLDSGLFYNIALGGGIGLGSLFCYWSYRKWVWPAQPPARPAAAQPRQPVLC